MLDMATKHIDIATFKAEINSKPRGRRLRLFFDTLFRKYWDGVEVRFLINWNDKQRAVPRTNGIVIRELKARKIEVRKLPGNRCCHAKILLVDQKRAIIGSHNLSVKSCHNNFEVSYLVTEPVSVGRLSGVFEHTWKNSQRI